MSKVTIDVAQESTLRDIYSKVEEGAGIWCKPEYVENGSLGANVAAGIIGSSAEGNVIINFRNNLYMITDNTRDIVTPGGLENSWWSVCKLPFQVDVHETCFIMFNGDLHMLGGDGNKVRAHYKWNGERWTIASELPYDFCNGKVVEYQGKLHIFGGGSAKFYGTYSTGRLNNHYAWDGERWEKASDLPYPVWGCTPFVCAGKLHLIGGGIYNDKNYNQTHYIWDGISWSKGTDLPFTVFNGSVAKVSDTQIYIFGGANQSGGQKQNLAKMFNGSSWSNVTNLPVDAFDNTGMGATVDANRRVVVAGRRLFTLSGGSYIAHMATPGTIDKGDAVLYRGEVHIFCQRNHYKWTSTGWTKVSTIPYNFVGGSVVVYNDKINLLGSSSSGVEDYHYTWSPEDGWKLKSNLPGKFSNGSAVVLNDELHIIGGTNMNGETYNHYKLVNARWETVGHTIGSVIGPKCAVVHDGLIYAATQADDAESTVSNCEITVFDGVGWSKIGSVTTNITSKNYRYLVVFQNRIHLMVFNSDRLFHYALTGTKTTIGHTIQCIDVATNSVPCVLVYKNRIYIFSSPKADAQSIIYLQYAVQNVPLVNIYIPKNHQVLCNKADLFPIIGEVEETDAGYKALSTGLYTFVNYADKFSIS